MALALHSPVLEDPAQSKSRSMDTTSTGSTTEFYLISPRANKSGTATSTTPKDGQRGRSAHRRECAENASHDERLATARQRAVAEVAEAQNKERERLCVFKSAGDGVATKSSPGDENPEKSSMSVGAVGQHSIGSACGRASLDEECMTPSKWPESLRQEETPGGTPSRRDLSSSLHDHRSRLTKPVGPRLHTRERSDSRSLSVGHRSFSEPPREFHSFAEMVESFNEKGVRYSRQGQPSTPDRSVRSNSVRSARSVSSARGRVHSTSTLTYPRGPELATEARANTEFRRECFSRSVSRGTPERSVRSTYSVTPARQSEAPLTVPCGPNLTTAKRSRSRSVHSRTPSLNRPERPAVVEEKSTNLPRVTLQNCLDKKATAASPVPAMQIDPVELSKPKPTDENAKPIDENSKPAGEDLNLICDKARLSDNRTKLVGESIEPATNVSKDEKSKLASENTKLLCQKAMISDPNAKLVGENINPNVDTSEAEQPACTSPSKLVKRLSDAGFVVDADQALKAQEAKQASKPLAVDRSASMCGHGQKDPADKREGQKPKSRGPLSQLNITDYLPGDEAMSKTERAEMARVKTVSELARAYEEQKEQLFKFGPKKGARGGAGEAAAPTADVA